MYMCVHVYVSICIYMCEYMYIHGYICIYINIYPLFVYLYRLYLHRAKIQNIYIY